MDSSITTNSTNNSTNSTNMVMPNVLQQYNYQYNLFSSFYPQNYFSYNINSGNLNDQNVPPPPPPYNDSNAYYNRNLKQPSDNVSHDNYNQLSLNNQTYQNDNNYYSAGCYQNFYDYSAYASTSYVQECTQNAEPVRTTTPDKPIMNDSGVGISPNIANASLEQENQLLKTTPALYSPAMTYTTNTQQPSKGTSNANTNDSFDDNDDDDEEDSNHSTGNSPTIKTSKSTSSASLMKPPKPYLEIIADAILTVPDRMMQLHEIYQYMESKFPYFAQNVNKSWRNSVRHNLSLNECFVKAGRGSNGKGNYWKIHSACENDFVRGNFRRKNFKLLIRSSNSAKQQQQQQNQISATNLANYNPLNSLSYFNSQLQSFNIENFFNSNQINYNSTNNQTQSNHHRSSLSSNHRYQPY